MSLADRHLFSTLNGKSFSNLRMMFKKKSAGGVCSLVEHHQYPPTGLSLTYDRVLLKEPLQQIFVFKKKKRYSPSMARTELALP